MITVFWARGLLVSKVEKQCWCGVVCVCGHENIFYQPDALLSPSKWSKTNFTCQDLSKEDDLYHLFNTAPQTSLQNHKALVGTEPLILFESSSWATQDQEQLHFHH